MVAKVFVNRDDVYALQSSRGGYIKIEKPLTLNVIKQHLEGKKTIGTYQLNKRNMVKWLCLDLDPEHLDDPNEAAQKIIKTCFEKPNGNHPRIWGHSLLLEASRYPDPSFHLWILFLTPVPAKFARWLGLRILELANLNPKEIEIFPKQTELTPERPYGNLVKLPLGLHQVERKWSKFLDPETFKPLPNDVLLNCVGLSFPDEGIEKVMTFKEKRHIQVKLDLPKTFKPLPYPEEEKAVRFLCKYWRPGYRNQLEMCFLGWCLKKGVSFDSAYRIIDKVTRRTRDEERAHRLSLVDYHYRNRISNLPNLKGASGLREIIERLVRNGG